jgi:ubiquinone/menaquinone biosynthesis C-methylase UbiE
VTRYIHGTAPEEQERLVWMNQLLNDQELAAIAPRGDERALELGAGTGIFACALARRLARGSVVALELDEHQLARARAEAETCVNIELRQGDVYSPPLCADEWGSFDLVHARFLLEHLTDPQRAVHVMARAVRPGGRVILVDDDHDTLRLWPAAPAFERLWRAYCAEYERRGMDPWVGRRLAELACAAGLEPLEAHLLEFGACNGMPRFSTVIQNLIGVVASAGRDLVAGQVLTEDELAHALDEVRVWSTRRDAALWYAVPWLAAERPLGTA